MHALNRVVGLVWVVFWIYWLISAVDVKQGLSRRRGVPLGGVTILSIIVLERVFRGGSLAVHSPVLAAAGVVLFALGISLAVWARVRLGRNWGMPMTQKAEPQLVTSGPYRFVRHPIYSGLLLGVLGTALVINLSGLAVVAVLCGYFYYSASVEERNLTATFPSVYPTYRTATKMLIPFVL